MHADDSSYLSFTQKLSMTRLVNGIPVLRYDIIQSKDIYPGGISELRALVIMDKKLRLIRL